MCLCERCWIIKLYLIIYNGCEYNSLISVYLKYRNDSDDNDARDDDDDDDTIVVQLFQYNILASFHIYEYL